MDNTPDDYISTVEKRLWYAVLASYFVDASMKRLDSRDWQYLLFQAQSDWTKAICSMIDLDHDFFLDTLIKFKNSGKKFTMGTVFEKEQT
jgi:hypothetical protein